MRRFPAITLVLLAILVIAGCGGDDGPSAETDVPATTATATTPTATAPSATTAPSTTGDATVTVFFLDSGAQRLIEETRQVVGPVDLRDALTELAAGPRSGDAVAALPAGTQVVGTLVSGGEASVNFDQAFLDGYPSGGSAAEIGVLAPIVYTATALPGVERVRITVDGQVPQPAGTQFDWTQGFARDDFPDLGVTP